MKPKAGKSWDCGRCRKTYPHTAHGKALAESCCVCRTCGSPTYMTYIGVISYECKRCCLKKSLQSAIAHQEGVEETLRLIRGQAAEVGFVLDYNEAGVPVLREKTSEMREQPSGVRGLHHRRTENNPNERAFAEQWEKNNPMDRLLDGPGSTGLVPSHRDHVVAATVIQWLGSPVGHHFLSALGYERKRKKSG